MFAVNNLLYFFFQRLKSAATEKEGDTTFHARCVNRSKEDAFLFVIIVFDFGFFLIIYNH